MECKTYIVEVQEQLEGYEEAEFAKYNLVDINNYTEEELLKEETFISKAMLIEKSNNTNDLPKNLEKIIIEITKKPEIYMKEQKQLLITIINLALRKKLDNEEADKMIERLKGGEFLVTLQ